MSVEPAGAGEADASKSSKGKGPAATTDNDSSVKSKDKVSIIDQGAGNADGDAATGGANGDSTAAESSTATRQRNYPAPIPAETPDELRAQLEVLRRELAANLQKKQAIDRQLVAHEAAIYAFETSYLSVDISGGMNAAPFGNIVRGYDSYLKSGSSAFHTDPTSRKKGGSSTRGGGTIHGIVGPGGSLLQPVMEEDRIFSRSSVTYMDSLQLRERDTTAVMSASEGEDEQDEDVSVSGAAGGSAGREAKRQRKR